MPGPVFLCAPGAGAPSSHPWMQRWQELLAGLGPTQAFDYPYQRAGRRAPDALPRLIAAHRVALAAVRAAHPGRPVVLFGKSMGSRVGCHVAALEPVAAVVCLGYPLVPPGGGAPRTEALQALAVPALLVSGTRDPFAPPGTLEEVVAGRAGLEVVRVPDGDHSLEPGRRALAAAGHTQEDVDASIFASVTAFLQRVVPRQ